tara:strand:- start:1169 stop:2155 length:987 start_codon:yes stop_codon:yes gene_type:complete
MARRRGNKKDLQMTQRFLYYNLTNTASSASASGRYEDSHYIDLAAGLSAINRRLYRQGRQYHIANISLIDTQGDTKVRFCTLPQVWTTSKAHKLMFDAWKDQRARALENSPSNVTGRWADFKTYMSQQHAKEARELIAAGKPGVTLPVFSDLDAIPDGEWEYSDVTYLKSGNELSNQTLFMMGNHISGASAEEDGVGVLTALQEMMAIPPESPILPANLDKSIIMSMNPATGTDNVDTLANIMDDNDLSPYAGTRVLGADSTSTNSESLVIRELGWSAQGIASLPAMGFPVPLGLLEVRQDDKDEGNVIGLIVELVPGEYKGVHAEAF